ncbi:MAG: sterol desaturase family protein, partial [Gammaproteobacteria bacterium]|nr:sterol desaturase family protein [Gammaproteobacteria bacterium]
DFANALFDILFARNDTVTIVQAVLLTGILFAGLYLFAVVPSFLLLRNSPHKIENESLARNQIRKEILASLRSVLVFALLGGITFNFLKQDWLRVNGDIAIHQWLIEILLLYLWNEMHFYFSHRLLHVRPLFRYIHKVHHQSRIVTPFSTWSFHWLEAAILGSVLPLAILIYPFSVWSLALLPVISLFWNIIGHSNVCSTNPFLGIFSQASARHAMHHKHIDRNFGFSLPYFDRWLGTSIERGTSPP